MVSKHFNNWSKGGKHERPPEFEHRKAKPNRKQRAGVEALSAKARWRRQQRRVRAVERENNMNVNADRNSEAATANALAAQQPDQGTNADDTARYDRYWENKADGGEDWVSEVRERQRTQQGRAWKFRDASEPVPQHNPAFETPKEEGNLLFVFGTLLYQGTRDAMLGRDYREHLAPAALFGYRKTGALMIGPAPALAAGVSGGEYAPVSPDADPKLVQQLNSPYYVPGLLLPNLSYDDMINLDAYEGISHNYVGAYDRIKVKVAISPNDAYVLGLGVPQGGISDEEAAAVVEDVPGLLELPALCLVDAFAYVASRDDRWGGYSDWAGDFDNTDERAMYLGNSAQVDRAAVATPPAAQGYAPGGNDWNSDDEAGGAGWRDDALDRPAAGGATTSANYYKGWPHLDDDDWDARQRDWLDNLPDSSFGRFPSNRPGKQDRDLTADAVNRANDGKTALQKLRDDPDVVRIGDYLQLPRGGMIYDPQPEPTDDDLRQIERALERDKDDAEADDIRALVNLVARHNQGDVIDLEDDVPPHLINLFMEIITGDDAADAADEAVDLTDGVAAAL